MTAFVIILAVIVYIAEQWSLQTALNGIEFDYELSKRLVEPEEEFELRSTLINTSRRLVPFIKVTEYFPKDTLCKSEGIELKREMRDYLKYAYSAFLTPRSKLSRRIKLALPKRGRYVFSGSELSGGDFLGLKEESHRVDLYKEIIVYPKRINTPEIMSAMGGLMGDISVRRFIMEDPVITLGIREYTGKEPMKSISWTHSAKSGRLMVKQYDHTIEPAISVMLDVENDGSKEAEELVERAMSIARTVCEDLEEKKMKYEFITNAATSDSFSRWTYVSEDSGLRHISYILEGLGRASYRHMEPFIETTETFLSKGRGEKSVIIITLQNDLRIKEAVRLIERRTGGKAFVISAEEVLP